ncbi:MAG: amidohydrolase family protein [Spirochaetaceae bacterium]|jgi:predicted TIM-barrel fold metal-dependent hydrolase|nr:amidohydrolase family protein [Spirochaetaceae bacterium]
MIIDFHSHIYPEKIAAKAVASTEAFYTIPARGRGTPEDLGAAGRRAGIDRFVVFSAAAVPAQVTSINDYIALVCSGERKAGGPAHGDGAATKGGDAVRPLPETPGPIFTGFGTLHPGMENPGAEIDRIIGLGLRGLKFHPDMQKFSIDDERMMNIYALLEGRLPVVFHTGDYRYTYSHPSRLAPVLDAFPRLTVIAAHFGGWSLFDLGLEYFRNRHCYFDLSSSIPYLGRRRTEELICIYGADRILFGSDYPIWDPGECLAEFRDLSLSSAEQERILSGTALEILG